MARVGTRLRQSETNDALTNDLSIEGRWVELFDELRCTRGTKDRIAGLFLSVRGRSERTILYVGKATAGMWHRDDANGVRSDNFQARVEERRLCTRTFLEKEVCTHTYNSGFWNFARELNAEAASTWRLPAKKPVQHITWTNLCKIGAVTGNPDRSLLAKQRTLAIETLRWEIKLYKPELICFVTWDFAWDAVKEVFGDPSDASWDQNCNKEWMWYRAPCKGFPGALLLGHPQGKRTDLRRRWLQRITELLAVGG